MLQRVARLRRSRWVLPAVIHTASSGKVPALPYWLTPIGGGEGGFGVDSVLVRTYATPMVPP